MPRKPKQIPAPSRRRSRGTGSVDFHKPSQLWRARLPKKLDPGQRPEYFAAEPAAHQWLDDELARLVRLAAGPNSETPLWTYLSGWLDTVSVSADWSASTIRTQASHLEYLRPLGHRPLDSVSRADIQQIIAAMQQGTKRIYKRPDGTIYHKPPRGSYIRNVVGTWTRAFQSAVDDGLIQRNPCTKLILPPGGSEPGATWLPAEAAILVPAILDHRYEAVFALLFGCALRIGEARGLAWDDVDRDGRRAFIHRNNDPRVGVQDRVKGRAGKWVPLPLPVLAALDRQRARQTWEAVYISEHAPGRTASYDVIVKHLKRLAVEVGVRPLNPHAARHAAGTVMGAQGIPLATIAERLRHKNRRVTERYVHSESVGEDRATDLLADLFSGPKPPDEG